MLFSIVIPAYNCQDYIVGCLKSVLNQTFHDYEIIVVDDGSTDDTAKLIKEMSNDKIRLCRIRNAGASNARNVGIKEANGDYIVFLDADDIITPLYLEKISNEIGKSKRVFYLGSVRTDFDSLTYRKKVRLFDSQHFNQLTFPKNLLYLFNRAADIPCACWHNIVARNFLIKNHIKFDTELILSEDTDFFLQILNCSPSIKAIDISGYFHRINLSTSVSSTLTVDKMLRALLFVEKWFDSFDSSPIMIVAKTWLYLYYNRVLRKLRFLNASDRNLIFGHFEKEVRIYNKVPLGKIYLLRKKRFYIFFFVSYIMQFFIRMTKK